MKAVTSQEMQTIDRLAVDEYGIPAIDLMERAGQGVVRSIEATLLDLASRRAVIFCGKGNNGGDGFVVARLLLQRGVDIDLYLLGSVSEVRGEAKINFERARGLGLKVTEVHRVEQIATPLRYDIVVDAIFGTGGKGPLRELPAQVVDLINHSDGVVIAVDVPSGLDCATGAADGPCVRADVTATMGLPKIGTLLYPGKALAGRLDIVDIGLPSGLIGSIPCSVQLIEVEDIRQHIPRRPPQAHKGDCGRVAVVAGSVGMTGAAALCCLATLRAGAGMTILGIAESLNDVMEAKLTETMTRPLPETDQRTLSLAAGPGIEELAQWADVLAIGPGLSQHAETQELVRSVIHEVQKPAVIDADGLNALAGHLECLKGDQKKLILTPHVGELARLIARPIPVIEANRIMTVRHAAKDLGSVVVLKGAPTVVSSPAGPVFINSTGNAGMATAGCGDVLTGLIAGLLAQGLGELDAAVAGVYLHGLAGDLVARDKGEWGLVAGDIIERLPEAILSTARSEAS